MGNHVVKRAEGIGQGAEVGGEKGKVRRTEGVTVGNSFCNRRLGEVTPDEFALRIGEGKGEEVAAVGGADLKNATFEW